MKIAIIVAMQKEIDLLLPLLETKSTLNANDNTYYLGRLGHHEIILMKCGIGKVNAAIGTLTLIDTFHPRMVINTGVAGGTGRGAGILDVVVASGIAYHDVWCGPGTVDGQAAGCPARFGCPLPADVVASLPVKSGLVASGDIFVSRPEDITRILTLYPDAIAVDMESAAIAQVCYIKNVPMVCIRVVSDTPGSGDNIEQYKNFWDDAPVHVFETLRLLLEKL